METRFLGLGDRLDEPLETFLVEWKQDSKITALQNQAALETFLVEWKR